MLEHLAEWEPLGFLVKEVETSALEDQAESAVVVCSSTVNLLQSLFCEYSLAQTFFKLDSFFQKPFCFLECH